MTDLPGDSPLRILVVDDDALSRDLMMLVLGVAGHVVTAAESGEDALGLLSSLTPSSLPELLLIDWNMPGLHGAELALRLREQAGSHPRMIAMSATPLLRIPPYDGFLLKPFDLESFDAMLHARPSSSIEPPVGEQKEVPVLDDATYNKLRSLMPAASLREVYDACLNDALHRIAEMQGWLAENKVQEVRRSAHALKGGAGMVGATRLASVASRLELDRYDSATGPHLLEELSTACEELGRMLLSRNG